MSDRLLFFFASFSSDTGPPSPARQTMTQPILIVALFNRAFGCSCSFRCLRSVVNPARAFPWILLWHDLAGHSGICARSVDIVRRRRRVPWSNPDMSRVLFFFRLRRDRRFRAAMLGALRGSGSKVSLLPRTAPSRRISAWSFSRSTRFFYDPLAFRSSFRPLAFRGLVARGPPKWRLLLGALPPLEPLVFFGERG